MDARDIAAALRLVVRGEIEEHVLMKYHTSMRVGGPADVLVRAFDPLSVSRCLEFGASSGVTVTVIGAGTNLIVKDGGIRGVVLRPYIRGIRVHRESGRLAVGAGEMLWKVAVVAAEQGLSGLEFAAGIPGSVGGALAMNAGAFGHCVGELVEKVTVLTPGGQIRELDASQAAFDYRSSRFRGSGEIVLSASLVLVPGERRWIEGTMAHFLEARKRTQPQGVASAGSVFKNPKAMPEAGWLLERAGMKGVRVGDAQVSTIHANFIVNLGRATAADVLTLMEMMRESVKSRFGVELEPEVAVLGEDAQVGAGDARLGGVGHG